MMKKLILILLLICWFIGGCGNKENRFKEGDVVIHKLSGLKGQVIEVPKFMESNYFVRFYVGSNPYGTTKFGPPIRISQFQVLSIKPFEIKLYEEN